MAAGGGQVTRGSLTWIRRLSFAAVLLVVAVAPGPAAGSRSGACTGPGGPGGSGCGSEGTVRWSRLLPGAWVAQPGLLGTTPAHGQAYAALGDQVAALEDHVSGELQVGERRTHLGRGPQVPLAPGWLPRGPVVVHEGRVEQLLGDAPIADESALRSQDAAEKVAVGGSERGRQR